MDIIHAVVDSGDWDNLDFRIKHADTLVIGAGYGINNERNRLEPLYGHYVGIGQKSGDLAVPTQPEELQLSPSDNKNKATAAEKADAVNKYLKDRRGRQHFAFGVIDRSVINFFRRERIVTDAGVIDDGINGNAVGFLILNNWLLPASVLYIIVQDKNESEKELKAKLEEHLNDNINIVFTTNGLR